MAASMKNGIFDSVQTLLQLLNDIERKKIIAQKTCEGYHDLFKPWSHDRDQENEEKKDKIEPVQTEEDKMSTVEKAELELVNKLLSKAEKAYKVKEQLSAPKRPLVKEGTRASSKLSGHDVHEEQRSVSSSNTNNNGRNDVGEDASNTDTNKNERTKDNTTRNDKTLITDVKGKANPVRPNLTKNQINSTKPVITETEKNKNTAKYGGRSRIENRRVLNPSLPHIKAPFQTNPSIPFPRKSTSITKSVPQVRPTSASRYKQIGKKQETSKNKGISLQKGQGQIRKGAAPRLEKDNSAVSDTVQSLSDHIDENVCHGNDYDNDLKQSNNQELTENVENDREENIGGRVEEEDISRSGNLENGDSDRKQQLADDTVAKNMSDCKLPKEKPPEKERFHILTDGLNLTVPVKLKKYAAQNRKLKQKYDMYKMTKKVNGIPAAEKFKSTIEMTFTDIEEWTLLKNVTDMTNIYNNLKKYFTSLNLEHISGESSPYVLMRTRKALEMILSTFQQTEEQRNKLNIECFHNADCIGTCHVCVLKPSPCKPSLWIPRNTKDVWLPYSPSMIQYRSVRQLEHFTALLFQLQYLQFQCYVHDVLAEEILPFLYSVHPKSSEFVHLLRSSFSLLTDDVTFPVVVRDTIQELEESMVDHDS